MKNLLIGLLAIASVNVFAIDAEIVSNLPATISDQMAKGDGMATIQSMIDAISKAQNIEQQLSNLKNLSNFQQNPGQAVQQVNSAVSNLLNNLNSTTGSKFQNLSQLIGNLAGSTTAAGMNLKLMSAANTTLIGIQGTLQTIQAQNQAMIAYKQAEIADQQTKTQQNAANRQASANSMNNF